MALGSHPFLQRLLHRHERLLSAAAGATAASEGDKKGSSVSAPAERSVVVLLPSEDSMRGLNPAEQLLVETHICTPTATASQFVNLRGQGIHREDRTLVSGFGFSSSFRVEILAEEVIYNDGVVLQCFLIAAPLLPNAAAAAPASSTASARGNAIEPTTGPDQARATAEERENLEKIERAILAETSRWRAKAGAAVENQLDEEIRFFKETYVLALGCDAEIALRLRELVTLCTQRVLGLLAPALASPQGGSNGGAATGLVGALGGRSSAGPAAGPLAAVAAAVGGGRFLGRGAAASQRPEGQGPPASNEGVATAVEGFVFLRVHDTLWTFAVKALSKRQARLEAKLKGLRENLPFLYDRLQVKPLLRGVSFHASAELLNQLSAWKLPQQKTACLAWAVRNLQRACRSHVHQLHARQQRRAELERKQARLGAAAALPSSPQPVEITVDDLVALLLVAAALSGGRQLLANVWLMTVFNLQKPREAQFDESSFYLTTLHSALSFALVVDLPEAPSGLPRTGGEPALRAAHLERP
ncbi:hypothetical protein BESB_031080 [Besnoitia besnoiti]|uniref:VPS9 domain-containing protein n=1 Tax=Besnoitia besnoiti TaxID=94643 RepID=A0A2A9M1W3_BESBE|nr:hypothetical protein BESB_031080 [Besnoitia besnoiti]PFH31234.1 hypothetical protein BESB_031080 [Besnoitia besnoiti]